MAFSSLGAGAPTAAPAAGGGMEWEETMFQKRLAQIRAMPEGEAKQAALQALAMDYPGRIQAIEQQQEMAKQMATAPMPEGKLAGSHGNPYSVYIGASPIGMAATAAGQFKGHRNYRDLKDQREKLLSKGEEQTQALLAAALLEDEEKEKYGRRGPYF